jgi:hypothetical protein
MVLDLNPQENTEKRFDIWLPLMRMGRLSLSQGNIPQAQLYFHMAVSDFLQYNQKQQLGFAHFIDALAVFSSMRGDMERAVKLFGAVETVYQYFQYFMLPRQGQEHDDALQAALQALGEEAFCCAWEEGRAMAQGQAIELAIAGLEEELA